MSDWDFVRCQWSLRSGVSYLNHGSFGPSPQPVLAARRAWLERLESEPMDFLVRELDDRLAEARQVLGRFVGSAADDLLFVDNATVGMNLVAANLRLQPGDEVLANDHEYGAVLRTWERACRRSGARLVVGQIPVPLTYTGEVVDAIFRSATDRTKLIVFSHVTSPTAIVMPAEAISLAARHRGIPVCIDGPHALAMRPLELARLDCDYYTASCHKWLCAPFGSGFLYVHPRRQATMEPLVVSWGRTPEGHAPSWRDEFTWSGTRDPSTFLATAAAIEFLEKIGLDAFRERTHQLARRARSLITSLTGLDALVPDSPEWYGSMISLPLPPGEAAPLQQALWEKYQIEVPIVEWNGRRLVRPSCHLYTQEGELERLAEALRELVRGEV
jgi:isopenicillin-N epimerase